MTDELELRQRPDERRKAGPWQRASLVVEAGLLIAVATSIFASGRMAERSDKVAESQRGQSQQVTTLNEKVSSMSGQMLQFSNTSNVAAVEGRVLVLESKTTAIESLTRELKIDMTDRLKRIEMKIDQQR